MKQVQLLLPLHRLGKSEPCVVAFPGPTVGQCSLTGIYRCNHHAMLLPVVPTQPLSTVRLFTNHIQILRRTQFGHSDTPQTLASWSCCLSHGQWG